MRGRTRRCALCGVMLWSLAHVAASQVSCPVGTTDCDGAGTGNTCAAGMYKSTEGTQVCQQCVANTRSTKFQTALLTRGSRYLRCVRSQTSPDMKTLWHSLLNHDAKWLDPNVCAGRRRPFIVLAETKPSKRHIPVWAQYSPLRTRVEAHANTLSP